MYRLATHTGGLAVLRCQLSYQNILAISWQKFAFFLHTAILSLLIISIQHSYDISTSTYWFSHGDHTHQHDNIGVSELPINGRLLEELDLLFL